MTILFALIAILALLFLSSVVLELRKAAFGIAVIASCYVAWLKGQPEYAHEAEALLTALGVDHDAAVTTTKKEGGTT